MAEDFFQEIAMTKHPSSERDREVMPRERCTEPLKRASSFPEGIDFTSLSFEERCQSFEKDLERMRKQYKPFMENHLPEVNSLLECREISCFEFRYLEKTEIFSRFNRNDVSWESVTIPDYRGPAGEKGRWRGCYRTSFPQMPHGEHERIILRFQCVDYKAKVYLNGNFVCSHEGFFAPFEFDITDYQKPDNELIVECINDIPTLGVGPVLDGDKIYAATGPGWDDPEEGWHHCPAGAGIFGRVTLERRPEIFITDIFVRPDIDSAYSEIRIGIENYAEEIREGCKLEIHALPRNYAGAEIGALYVEAPYIGSGPNEYRYRIPLSGYRLWEPDSPWLYGAVVTLSDQERILSRRVSTFGMKQFICHERSCPKGKFTLNHKPCILRGANEMGHLQQCVMRGDYDQLVDDILIAKLCHLNYFRVTQRPVQEEIYDYFDMLGIFHQCDLPLFGYLRRNQFAEAVRQAGEMEHLIRGHVSTVMVSLINEPMCIRVTEDPNDKFSRRYRAKGHRDLFRDELEAFFTAARQAIYTENPDRVVKNAEGDYDGPTREGLPDFHIYTMWYTNHGVPVGKLLKGYLPPIKEGWMTGCGEYGAEGLDNEPVMRKYYPPEWLALREDGSWFPDQIPGSQSFSNQGDWYPEQETITDWIRESQIHQANATILMTDAFRRRADIINHTAIHLLIDAWPSGWMKALLDCDRHPKMAFFALQDSLIPLRVHLWCPRNRVYEGEELSIEVWLLNDTGKDAQVQIRCAVKDPVHTLSCWKKETCISAASSRCAGLIPLRVPAAEQETRMTVDACILDEEGKCLNTQRWEFLACPRNKNTEPVAVIGREAERIARRLGLVVSSNLKEVHSVLASECSPEAEDLWKQGKKLVLLLPDEKDFHVEICGQSIALERCQEVFFAASSRGDHLSMLYNEDEDCLDFVGRNCIKSPSKGENLIYTCKKEAHGSDSGRKKKLPFVKVLRKERLVLISLLLDGRIGVNPGLDTLITDCLFS